VLARLAKQTRAIIIIRIITAITMTVAVETRIKKLLITRLYKRLKRKRIKLKNDG
jgi:hypothetical protein